MPLSDAANPDMPICLMEDLDTGWITPASAARDGILNV